MTLFTTLNAVLKDSGFDNDYKKNSSKYFEIDFQCKTRIKMYLVSIIAKLRSSRNFRIQYNTMRNENGHFSMEYNLTLPAEI